MPDLPAMLKVRGWRVVIVGGGAVARRRAVALIEAGADVTVIAPQIDAELAALDVQIERRAYCSADLAGARLVIIATDSREVNQQVAADAAAAGALVNRADDPDAGDLAIPAHAYRGPITLAVSTAGISARAAAQIRDDLLANLDPAWIELLTIVAPFRGRLQERVHDAAKRNDALRALVSDEAMALLKLEGADALRRRSEAILATAALP